MKKKVTRTAPNPKAALSMETVTERLNKRCGKGTVFHGTELKRDVQRIPFGVFPFDFTIGGGAPIWGSTCLWGPETGGKTLLAVKGMRSSSMFCWKCFNPLSFCTCSQASLKMRSFWADVEGTLDQGWVEQCGVPSASYSVALCDYGEQYVDVCEAILEADDCGLLIIDSLAALMPEDELDASASQKFMGNQSKMITNLVKKLRSRLNREMKRGHPCAVIFTNQMRKRLGVMFGDPEEMPGGHAARHEMSLIVRCARRSFGKKKSEDEPASAVGDSGDTEKYTDGERKKDRASRHSFTVRKEKLLTLAGTGEFILIKEDLPSLGLKKGMVDDFNALYNYARAYEVVTKHGSEYRFLNLKAKSMDSIKAYWRTRPEEYLRADMEIVKRAKIKLAEEKKKEDA